MMKKLLSLSCILLFTAISFASEKPYFQQEVNYKINVSLNDKKHTLSASMEMEYINRSIDTLTFLWIHLWPNAYKNRSSALVKQQLLNNNAKLYFSEDKNRGYIDSLNFTVDGTTANWSFDPTNIDICKLNLPKPLYPGQRAIIKTPFFVQLPSATFSRLGHIGQAYAITQWYPKPAVYDIDGWHPIPYLDQGEFYSEYGNFEVSITLPSNYVVGATGDLVNGEKELAWMDQKANETLEKINSNENSNDKPDLSFPLSSLENKTLIYRQQNVHDFAWFADKRYHVLKGEATMPASGRKVTTWSLFTNNEFNFWKKSSEYIKDALEYYSGWIGDYPYNQCTAVDGTIAAGGGMEYPNVTIIGECGNALTLETTIVHEVGHNWFYGIFGSNEREHPWMDEGINTFYQTRYLMTKYPPSKFGPLSELNTSSGGFGKVIGLNKLNFIEELNLVYLASASSNSDQAIEGPSPDFRSINYGTIVYSKSALAFNYLKEFMGDTAFDFAMKKYFKEWSFRHPTPENLKQVFVESNGNNYDWFFNDVIQTNKKADFAIKSVKDNGNGYTIKIKNKGDLTIPFPVKAYLDGKETYSQWITPTEKISTTTFPPYKSDKVVIDPDFITPDTRSINNTSRTNGIFKKVANFGLKFIGEIPYPSNYKIYFTPAVAWNQYDELMGGFAFYNKLIPFRKFEYAIVPMYSFKEGNFTGVSNFNYMFHTRNNLVRSLDVGLNARRFSYNRERYRDSENSIVTSNLYYNRFEPYFNINISPKKFNQPITSQVKLSAVLLFADDVVFSATTRTSAIEQIENQFYRINYSYNNKRIVDPWSANLLFENNADFNKISATLNYRISYSKAKKGVDIRLFAGYLFEEDARNGGYGFNLSDRSTTRGSSDYAFDEFYFARSEGADFLGRQIAIRDGNFKAYTPVANNKQWVIALNLSAGLPVILPIKIFADLGTTKDLSQDLKNTYDLNTTFIADAGVSISLAKDAIEIFFPFIKSQAIDKYYTTNDIKFGDQIRFMFDLKKMNPFNVRNSLR